MAKKQIHIFLEEWQLDNLKEAAAINGRSVSQVVREICNSYVNLYKRKERIERAKSIDTHSSLEWEEKLKTFDYKCAACGADEYEKDHIIPIYAGGSDGIDNLQPLCQKCNRSKGSDQTRWKKNQSTIPPHPEA